MFLIFFPSVLSYPAKGLEELPNMSVLDGNVVCGSAHSLSGPGPFISCLFWFLSLSFVPSFWHDNAHGSCPAPQYTRSPLSEIPQPSLALRWRSTSHKVHDRTLENTRAPAKPMPTLTPTPPHEQEWAGEGVAHANSASTSSSSPHPHPHHHHLHLASEARRANVCRKHEMGLYRC